MTRGHNIMGVTLQRYTSFLNLSLDVLFVIYRIHNLRPTFKIPIHLVPFGGGGGGYTLSIIWQSYAAGHGMALVSYCRFLDNHRMNVLNFKICNNYF